MKTITLRQIRYHWGIYVLVLPAVLLVALFSYYPAISAMYHAFFRWNGDDISTWVGLDNFRKAFSDKVLAYAFGIVLIFIVANFVKMVPSVITAVVIHRMTSERSRYLYRVLFVIPMIIPGIVWLLIWKFFYDPQIGVLNKILQGTGGMWVLQRLDVFMPWLAGMLKPVHTWFCEPVFNSVWGMFITGIMVLSAQKGAWAAVRAWIWWVPLLVTAYALLAWAPNLDDQTKYHFVHYFSVIVAVVVGVAIVMDQLRMRRATRTADRMTQVFKWSGIGLMAVAGLLIITSMTWTQPTNLFDTGQPPWLGHKTLALPALIFWGFPWVGVVSVLLYLSGLGNIDTSVYEAADIDGCGWFRKFTSIELPLIMGQIRLNLVLMIIGTFQAWGLVFILWGDSGGPGGAAMLPGLYMFRKAFTDLDAGYACAIGLILFVMILLLTLINNKYVRVEK